MNTSTQPQQSIEPNKNTDKEKEKLTLYQKMDLILKAIPIILTLIVLILSLPKRNNGINAKKQPNEKISCYNLTVQPGIYRASMSYPISD